MARRSVRIELTQDMIDAYRVAKETNACGGNNCPHYGAISKALDNPNVWVAPDFLSLYDNVDGDGCPLGEVKLPENVVSWIYNWDYKYGNVPHPPMTYTLRLSDKWFGNQTVD